MALFVTGASIPLLATPGTEEIDPGSCASVLALIAGTLLAIRGLRKT
jgi:hypothetical protein